MVPAAEGTPMITVTTREDTLLDGSATARFIGDDHGADVSFFWVDAAPGKGPGFHWHPYTETWVVLEGSALLEADGESVDARPGDIVTVGAETVHRFRVTGEGNLRMLCIHASPTMIQTFVDQA